MRAEVRPGARAHLDGAGVDRGQVQGHGLHPLQHRFQRQVVGEDARPHVRHLAAQAMQHGPERRARVQRDLAARERAAVRDLVRRTAHQHGALSAERHRELGAGGPEVADAQIRTDQVAFAAHQRRQQILAPPHRDPARQQELLLGELLDQRAVARGRADAPGHPVAAHRAGQREHPELAAESDLVQVLRGRPGRWLRVEPGRGCRNGRRGGRDRGPGEAVEAGQCAQEQGGQGPRGAQVT